jgi:hypothetical protein
MLTLPTVALLLGFHQFGHLGSNYPLWADLSAWSLEPI